MHCDNVASLINKSQDQSYRVKNIPFGKKRRWDSSIELNEEASAKNIEAALLFIIHYGPLLPRALYFYHGKLSNLN